MSVHSDVLIVGGGLVGLSAALMCAKRGVAVTLIEANRFRPVSDQSYIDLDSRNTALSRRSVEIYKELGLWGELESHAQPVLEVRIDELGGFGKAKLVAAEESVESFGQVMENRWLGNRLLQMAQNNPLVTLLDSAVVEQIDTKNPKRVKVAYKQNQADSQWLTTSLLVAADGAHSVCRSLLNIAARSKSYNQHAVVAVVETSKPHGGAAIERFGPNGPLALLPLVGENRRSVVWIAESGEQDALIGQGTDAHFLQLLERAFGDEAGHFVKAGKRGAYPLEQVLAVKQVQGRCVVLGNAAHTLHPVAGQGFNLCLRDADTLSLMLSEWLSTHEFGQTKALHALLKRYESRRIKDQKRVARFCNSVVMGFGHKNPVVKFGRNLGLVLFEHVPGAKPLVAAYAMGLKS